MGKLDLRPVKGGFSRIVSAGSDAQKRRIQFRLTIATPDKALARQRLLQIFAMRDALVESGRGPEARYLMEQAAAVAGDDSKFAVALALAGRVSEIAPAPSGDYRTWSELARAWASGEARRVFSDVRIKEKRSADRDLQRIEWLEQFIGDVPLATFGKAEYRKALANLPERCKTNSTRRQYGQIVLKVMRIAHAAELISSNPLADTEAPKVERNEQPFFTCIFPDELYRLLAAELLPFEYRFLWGFMAIESPRIGKLREVRWHHIERDGCGAISIESKNGDVLYWSLSPGTLEALEELERRMPGLAGPFAWLTESGVNKAAKTLREHMIVAGNGRHALHETEGRRRRLRAHDTRATFVVNAKRSGRNEEWIKERTGHTTSLMIEKYNRLLSVAEKKGWRPIGRLDEALGLGSPVAAATSEGPGRGPASSPPADLGGERYVAQASRPTVSRDTSRDSKNPLRDSDAVTDRESGRISAGSPCRTRTGTSFRTRDFKCRTDAPDPAKPAESVGRDTPVAAGTDGPSQSAVTVLDGLRAAARAALEANNWALLHQLEPLIDAEQKRLTASVPVSLEAVRAKREGGK
jgi:integrase